MSLQDDLLSLDFAALRTLRLVYRLNSFTAAAEAIDVKQSTVSYTIDRLRKALGDPLFVRQGGGIAPTAHCLAIMPVVDSLLSGVENLSDHDPFDPAGSKAHLTVSCTSFAMGVLVPQVMRRLRREAPGIQLILAVGYHDFWNELLDGRVDLAISAMDLDTNGIYCDREIVSDYDVCVMDPGNPLAGKILTEDDIVAAWHLVAEPWPNFRQPHVREAEARGLTINRTAVTTSLSEIGDLVAGTDLIAAIPSRLARRWQGRVAYARFPFPVDTRMNLYWTAANHRSKLITWLRGVITDEAARLGPPLDV